MVELFPDGFEELAHADEVELAAYTNAEGAKRLWRAFGEVSASDVSEDWARRWQRFHRPARVGPLWIGPPWEEPPGDAVCIVIDPGRAFGTGAHETTRLCLELLLGVERGSLLDVGSGSGVLAIAGAKLGFAPVYAIDHDEPAVQATEANAAANDVALSALHADAIHEPLPAADVAVANLSLTAVERVAPRLTAWTLVTSGYLASERPSLRGFQAVDRRVAGNWAADRYIRAS
jgi:ribosomal protein L11 methyltransferase